MKKIFLSALSAASLFATAQNVGIGTGNPSRAKLEVHGAVDATSAIFGGESSGISLQRNWPGFGYNSYYNKGHRYMSNGFAAVQFVDPNTGYMAFDMFSAGVSNNLVSSFRRAMVISNEGNVSIGSGDYPTATLNIARGTAADGTAIFQGTHHRSFFNKGTTEDTYIRAGKTNGMVYINDIPGSKVSLNGFIGINTANPVYSLEIRQINGRGLLLVSPNHFNNWEILTEWSEGGLALVFNGRHKGYFRPSDGAYVHYSDYRLKRNIQMLPELLDKVMQLRPVTYEMIYNNKDAQKSMGFIAQDVRKVFPELVSVAADTVKGYSNTKGLHSLNYDSFSVLAIKAIQEQQLVIQSLQAQLNALQKSVNELQRRSN